MAVTVGFLWKRAAGLAGEQKGVEEIRNSRRLVASSHGLGSFLGLLGLLKTSLLVLASDWRLLAGARTLQWIPVHSDLMGVGHKPAAAPLHITASIDLLWLQQELASDCLHSPSLKNITAIGRGGREKMSQQSLECSVCFRGGKWALRTRHFLS